MMKRIKKTAIALVLASVILYPFAYIAASQGLFGEVEFGYYGEFYVAKHAFENSGCVERIEYSGVNKDTVLEEFHFKVTTKSGRVVLLWFDASMMDVSQLCYWPVGLSVRHPAHEQVQMFTMSRLSKLLKGKNIQARNMKEILCNIDELEEVCKENCGDANAILEVDEYAWNYLRLEFPTEKGLNDWSYFDIKEVDVRAW